MSRPVVTAILLEDLRREGKEIRLPEGALVTPAARDWLKEHSLPVTWEKAPAGAPGRLAVVMDPSLSELRMMRAMLDRGGQLAEVIEPAGGRSGMLAATRRLCGKIARGEVAKGVVFAADGPVPVCVANKHNGVRAALGVNIPMTEEACRSLGINVLVLEYPTLTPYQMKQMIDRLLAGASPPAEMLAEIEAVEQGGGRADR
ncbi:MAG TPA: RpiB/LacA/LacB family sugar-phosphate isomerase [Phycisphaerae bacterium]|nr:RpiB/LacA/LacB family sugar-phosphate isomerase [Phycisphaerae bacterium]HRR83441.1 RpiB/LacA/LacB family sugar-phosphate isomerase [Phycisphaerae bacterium]